MILFLLLFFGLQTMILFCCMAAGNDPSSQEISDKEQMEYLEKWVQKKSI